MSNRLCHEAVVHNRSDPMHQSKTHPLLNMTVPFKTISPGWTRQLLSPGQRVTAQKRMPSIVRSLENCTVSVNYNYLSDRDMVRDEFYSEVKRWQSKCWWSVDDLLIYLQGHLNIVNIIYVSCIVSTEQYNVPSLQWDVWKYNDRATCFWSWIVN